MCIECVLNVYWICIEYVLNMYLYDVCLCLFTAVYCVLCFVLYHCPWLCVKNEYIKLYLFFILFAWELFTVSIGWHLIHDVNIIGRLSPSPMIIGWQVTLDIWCQHNRVSGIYFSHENVCADLIGTFYEKHDKHSVFYWKEGNHFQNFVPKMQLIKNWTDCPKLVILNF